MEAFQPVSFLSDMDIIPVIPLHSFTIFNYLLMIHSICSFVNTIP
jgi:hypothetical protein